jgi:hypothetical protein
LLQRQQVKQQQQQRQQQMLSKLQSNPCSERWQRTMQVTCMAWHTNYYPGRTRAIPRGMGDGPNQACRRVVKPDLTFTDSVRDDTCSCHNSTWYLGWQWCDWLAYNPCPQLDHRQVLLQAFCWLIGQWVRVDSCRVCRGGA